MPKTDRRAFTGNRLAYIALVLLAVALTLRFRDISDRYQLTFHATESVRDPFELAEPNVEIISVTREAAAAGLGTGDVLVAIGGEAYRGAVDLHAPLRNARPGDRMAVTVRSAADGSTHETSIELQALPSPPNRDILFQVVLNLVLPLFCLALGLWVAAVRIRDPLAWVLLLMMVSFAEQSGGYPRTNFGYDDWLQPLLAGYERFSSNLWGVAMMLFGIYFPERLNLDRRWPWAKWILIVPLLLRAAQLGLAQALTGHHAGSALSIEKVLPSSTIPMIMQMTAVGLFFAGMGYKTGTATNPDARRRLFLLNAGATVSLTPIFILVIMNLVRGTTWLNYPVWLTYPTFMLLLLFPLTLAYVIVVHRALDVGVVLRQSVQYLLATSTVRVLQGILMFIVIFAAAYFAADAGSSFSRPQRIQIIALSFVGVFVIRRLADKLREWVDRRFFREAYNADQILSDLAEKVRTIVETSTLMETVAKRISESLHVSRVVLLLPNGRGFEPAYALGYAEPPRAVIPETSATTEQLLREKHAQVYLEDRTSWVYEQKISDDERKALEVL